MTYITASDYMQQDFEQRFLERARVFSRLKTAESEILKINKRVNTVEGRVNDILNITIPNLEARVKVYTDNKISSLQTNLLSEINNKISSLSSNLTSFIETEKNKIISRLKDSEDTLRNLITARFPFLETLADSLKKRLDKFESMFSGYIPKINLIDGIIDTINKVRTFADCIYNEYITGLATKVKARFDASIDVIKRIPTHVADALDKIRTDFWDLRARLNGVKTSVKNFVDQFDQYTLSNIKNQIESYSITGLITYSQEAHNIAGQHDSTSLEPTNLIEIIDKYDAIIRWIGRHGSWFNISGYINSLIAQTQRFARNIVTAARYIISDYVHRIYYKIKEGFNKLVEMITELVSKLNDIYNNIKGKITSLSTLGGSGTNSLDDAKFNLSAILPTKCLEIGTPTTGGTGGAIITETKNITLRYTQSVTVDIPTTIDRATLTATERGDTSLVKFEWTADNSKVTITALGTGTETTAKSTVVKYKDIRGNELVFNITVNPLQVGVPRDRSFSATIEVAADYSTSYSPGSERAPYTITRQADINIAEVKLKPDNTGVYILGKGAGSTSAVVTDNYNNTYHLTINVTPKGGIGKGLVEQTRFYEIGLK